MTNLIPPERVPEYAGGKLTVCGSGPGWDALSVRGYRYGGSDVLLPPVTQFLIVAYRQGETLMHRRADGGWMNERMVPGDVSLLTRATDSHWVWNDDIEVVHVYLTQDELSTICQQMYERDVQEVELHDELRADDPAIFRTAMLIAQEAASGGTGRDLLVQSLSTELSVHILRRHAHILFRETPDHSGLSFRQERAVRDYVDHHLGENITLDDLAACTGLSRYHFARRFRTSTGVTPHQYILQLRVAKARTMITRTHYRLADVALACGFSDQSHLNRVFKRHTGVTPAQFRQQS